MLIAVGENIRAFSTPRIAAEGHCLGISEFIKRENAVNQSLRKEKQVQY